MAAKSVLKAILRFFRRVIDEIEDLVKELGSDPLVLRALEADLGLPPGALEKAKQNRPTDPGIAEYVGAVSPTGEQFKVMAEYFQAYFGFWTNVFKAAQEEDASIVAEELTYRLFQLTTINLLKFRYPTAYYVMRLAGVLGQDLRLALEEVFIPEQVSNIFTGDYWKAENLEQTFREGYLRFRLDQAADLFLEENGNLPPAERIRRSQLGLYIFGLSDLIFLLGGFAGIEIILKKILKDSNLKIDNFFGWELPPGTEIPLSERIASRGYTLKLTTPAGPGDGLSAILTQFLLADEEGRTGWLLSLRGEIEFSTTGESEERPVKTKLTITAPDGLDVLIRFSGSDKFKVLSPESLVVPGLRFSIEPETPVTAAPAFSIPEVSGTRLEIGDFAFKLDLSREGFKLQAAAKKSALVLVSKDSDSFVTETLQSKEYRLDFDLGLTVDKDGVYLDGGSRFGATIPINKTVLGIKFQSILIGLNPQGGGSGSELPLVVATSLGFKLGPLSVVIEQIGFTINAGFTREAPPEGSLPIMPFLYLSDLGFKPPSGVGILVEGESVTGGGFLFFDREQEQYAGVLELEIRVPFLKRGMALKALGLLTTRLPDGSKGFSLLMILSLEFDPPFPLVLGFTLVGVGGLYGHHRTIDTNALREGLKNHTLDAILFPKDPVANAGRYLNTLRSVFPPARDRFLFGFALSIGFGTPALVTAELALIFETGPNPRRILLGQLHLKAPREGKAIIEIHMDALGIWDSGTGDFSLDARLYDSYIAFVKLSGDMALRLREGSDPYYLLSIGGYHPAFAVPPDFPRLARLTIKFADSKNLRLILSGYFAVTSNTKQAGGKFDFFAAFLGISLEGFFSIDVLWEDDGRFIADFNIKVALKYKGKTLLGAHAVGQYFGPEPKRLKGEVSIDLWLFSLSKSFDKTFGEDAPPAELPQTDPLPLLVAALQDERSWTASLPGGQHRLVSLRQQPRDGQVPVHPLSALSVRQQVLPLGVRIDRFAGGTVSGERQFAITRVVLGGETLAAGDLNPLTEFFAPAQFLVMSDDEKLARPSFESMPAGVAFRADALAFGGQASGAENQIAASEIDFEEVIVDANGQTVEERNTGLLSSIHARLAAAYGPAARSPLRSTGSAAFQAPSRGLRVRQPAFVVAGVDDLKTVPLDGDGATDGRRSYTEVQQALEKHLRDNPRARGSLQIVPGFQTEESE